MRFSSSTRTYTPSYTVTRNKEVQQTLSNQTLEVSMLGGFHRTESDATQKDQPTLLLLLQTMQSKQTALNHHHPSYGNVEPWSGGECLRVIVLGTRPKARFRPCKFAIGQFYQYFHKVWAYGHAS